MNIKTLLHCLGSALLVVAPAIGMADDTDIYINRGSQRTNDPMVMFSIDTRANTVSTICSSMSSCTQADYFKSLNDADINADLNALSSMEFFDLLRLALKVVLKNSEFDAVKVALMISHNQDTGNISTCKVNSEDNPNPACSNGAAVLRGFRGLGETSSRSELDCILKKLRHLSFVGGPSDNCGTATGTSGGGSGSSQTNHPYQGASLFFELYRYLRGGKIATGHYGVHDFESGNRVDNANMDAYASATWDTRIEDSNRTSYISPIPTGTEGECTRLYSMNFVFGQAADGSTPTSLIQASVANGGMGITLSSDPTKDVVNYMNKNDLAPDTPGSQNLVSYFFVKGNNQGQQNQVLPYATAGGTTVQTLGENPQDLIKMLTDILREIIATSTTFVAASVPVNVFNRASVVNNVYIALFTADAKPYWVGNVKKLQIGIDASNTPILVDALDSTQSAVDTDGRIRYNALTFWTDNSGTLLDDQDTANNVYRDRDGRNVDRGGAGQKIPGFREGSVTDENSDTGARQLFYYNGSGLAALNATTAVASDSTVQAQLGTTGGTSSENQTAALTLLQYIRGYDVKDGDADGVTAEPRKGVRDIPGQSWLMGDPLHSRPLPINYGTLGGSYSTSNPGIFIAVASNDGFMRIIRNTTTGGAQAGDEVWAFMPPEGMAVQDILKRNVGSTPIAHPYSVDGIPTSLLIDNNGDGSIASGDNDKAYLFFGVRRGGSAYYGFDVTNPLAPVFKWRIAGGSGDFAELGKTFSTPKVGYVNVRGTRTAALFFSGGYNTNKDIDGLGTDDVSGAGTSSGAAIYVVNAITGSLIWKAIPGSSTGPDSGDSRVFRNSLLKDSIPSDVTVADLDGDGLVDRLLVGDSGGRVWRADFPSADVDTTPDGDERDDWMLGLLGNFGRHYNNARDDDRRFFHEPDIARFKDSTGLYDAVLIGSGDRENPLDQGGAPSNYFYMVKDRNTATRSWKVASATTPSTVNSSLDQSGLADVTGACSLTNSCASGYSTLLAKGWKLQLGTVSDRIGSATGEKALSAPLTVNGEVFFTTYIPTPTSADCIPSEGRGRVYQISVGEGNPLLKNASWDGQTALSTGDRFQALTSPGIPAQVVFVPGMPRNLNILLPDLHFTEAPTSSRYRTYWYRSEK